MGLSESTLNTIIKPFSFLSHCKVNCDSPCCQSLCGDDNHCNCNIDTREALSAEKLFMYKLLESLCIDQLS